MRSLLGEAWISASFMIVAVAVLAESVPLFGIAAMVFATGGAARLWARLALEDVTYRRSLGSRRAFVGEEVDAALEVTNAKRLPVPWLDLREALPAALPVDVRVEPSGTPGRVTLQRQTALRGGERLRWPLRFEAAERGYYRLGPARLRSGDLFGLFEDERIVQPSEGLIVYPRTVPLPDLGLPSARPFGEQRGGSRLFEDPVYFVGLRDWVAGDSLRRVDWKATARAGRMQSRVYEPSHTPSVVIALNVTTMEHSWHGHDPVLLERNVMVAASVAREAFEAHSAIGLVANGAFADADRAVRLGAGRSPEQLARLLEALAMITAFPTGSLGGELERRGESLPAGATLVVITATMSDDLAATLLRLRSDGHPVQVIRTAGGLWEQPLPGIAVLDVAERLVVLEQQFEQERAERQARRAASSPAASRPAASGTRAAERDAPTSPTSPRGPARRRDEPPRAPDPERDYWGQRAAQARDRANGARQAASPGQASPEQSGPPAAEETPPEERAR